MVSSKQSSSTPVTAGDSKPRSDEASSFIVKQQFIAAAVSMSWQMAIVVLVPLVGGFKIDEHFKTSPLWTITGLVIAALGMALVVSRAVKEVSPASLAKKKVS